MSKFFLDKTMPGAHVLYQTDTGRRRGSRTFTLRLSDDQAEEVFLLLGDSTGMLVDDQDDLLIANEEGAHTHSNEAVPDDNNEPPVFMGKDGGAVEDVVFGVVDGPASTQELPPNDNIQRAVAEGWKGSTDSEGELPESEPNPGDQGDMPIPESGDDKD